MYQLVKDVLNGKVGDQRASELLQHHRQLLLAARADSIGSKRRPHTVNGFAIAGLP